ncbi:hypothetical protein PVT67_15650 [Gallaecimonas kandeliae]|uniref:hypothetical protein n=1 Tax=Gallaecimonas kandeliae TaxID=3029055 RepID=UPI002649B537|nr:hypothetical protein [Gallaecimonas kandeliae]WKE65077.1 hypothetical protein PVT67_15650 [Gallaecimonas kandeliae]
MTLEQRQAHEREKLEQLRDAMESRAHDLRSLMDVLEACKNMAGLDPLPHLKDAMQEYLKRSDKN